MKDKRFQFALIFLVFALGLNVVYFWFQNTGISLYERSVVAIKKNDPEGMLLLKKSVEERYPPALVLYGNYIEDTHPEAAEVYYKEASAQQYPEGMFNLSRFYLQKKYDKEEKKQKTYEEVYAELAKQGESLDVEIIEASEEECRLYQEAYEAEFQMQLDLITDRYNRMQKIKLVSDSDGEPTA